VYHFGSRITVRSVTVFTSLWVRPGARSNGAACFTDGGAVFACARGGPRGELGVGGGVPADAGEDEITDDQHRIVVGPGPRLDIVAVAPVGASGALPFPADPVQRIVAAAAPSGELLLNLPAGLVGRSEAQPGPSATRRGVHPG
jgi:hypothetical protein